MNATAAVRVIDQDGGEASGNIDKAAEWIAGKPEVTMLARSQAPFLMFALFSVGCGTGIASLVLTIPRFGLAGGAIVSTAIGILMAMTGGGLISWFASHFERPVQPQRRRDILEDLEDDRDR